MATIITKNSQTPGAVPSAASLTTGELAVNTADARLYTEHSDGSVREIIPSTVRDGGITTAKIADGNVTGAKLENSGVTAGTYTTATVTVDSKGRITSASSGSGGGVTSLNGQTGAIVNTSLGAIGSYQYCALSISAGQINPNGTTSGSNLFYPTNFTYTSDSFYIYYTNSNNYAYFNAITGVGGPGFSMGGGSGGTCVRVLNGGGNPGAVNPPSGIATLSGTWRHVGTIPAWSKNGFDSVYNNYRAGFSVNLWVRIA